MTTDRSDPAGATVPGSTPIADYALLSDCHSTALVSSEASIDWACLRRFDSGAAFCRLLDAAHGGSFSIRPREALVERSRRYLGATMVLETTMRTASGTLVVTDAFAMRSGGATDPHTRILRRAHCTSGSVAFDLELVPRFDYGAVHPWFRRHDDGRISAVGGDDALAIDATIPLEIDHGAARITSSRTLQDDEWFTVSVVAQAAHLLDPSAADAEAVERELRETVDWWEKWSETTAADGPYADRLERSALVLKSLTCAPTGAVVAASTTSLPEIPGGSKNWDYRYCWVRDATLTLGALASVGHHEVAQGFRDFVLRSSAGRGDELQIMYGCYGERRLVESELGHLAGWRDSRPVRVGNGAAAQTQLDVYGHLLDAAHLWHERSADESIEWLDGGIDDDEWQFLISVVDEAAARRHDPDAGIWELRGEPRHYVHSKVMVWVALDRGIRLVDDHGLELSADHLERWRDARDELRTTVERDGVDPDTGGFVQSFGSTEVDASLLKLALVGFVDANDARMIATLDAIQERLSVGSEGFLLRFRGDGDGASGGGPSGSECHEGVFMLCSFWLVEVLALVGRKQEAIALFERLCATANDVGLMAEEYDPSSDELLGNFPQAFTHLGLIAAERRLRGA